MVNENIDENLNDEPCEYEKKLEYIKTSLIGKIFFAGSEFGMERLDCMDEHGDILPEDQEVLNAKFETIMDIYKEVFDLVWNEIPHYVCNDCQEKLEKDATVQDIEKEIKKNNGQN